MTETPNVVVALNRVMQEVQAVAKGDRNSQQGYSFRGIDAVMNAVGPALRKHGVVVVPICEEANYRDVQTSTGKPSRECTVKVRYRFYGPAGDHIEAVTPGESMDFGDKGAPKAMSVAYRIVLLQALCLPTHEPEPDAATYQRANGGPQQEQQSPADLARSAVRAACAASGWSAERVADRYKAEHKVTLRAATDADSITKFLRGLYAVPDAELKEPAKATAQAATNGARA